MKSINMKIWEAQAVLADRKTVTRRVVKPLDRIPENAAFGYTAFTSKEHISARGEWKDRDGAKRFGETFFKLPYHPGDILYVRETWTVWDGDYEYKADVDDGYGPFCSNCTLDICAGSCNSVLKWRPSIHMPREAARIFLRVTDVRVERLQDIGEGGPLSAASEGFTNDIDLYSGTGKSATKNFAEFWNSTLKPADRALYGWDANPWAWVIEFERISNEEALCPSTT